MRASAAGRVAALLATAALAAACTPLQVERADARFREPSNRTGSPAATRPPAGRELKGFPPSLRRDRPR